jgi:hypothetical protein
LDDRYFRGLEGKYDFDLHFVLQERGCDAGDHIVRARGAWFGNRSISAEVDLEAGVYEVLPKIEASRDADAPDVQEVVIKVADRNPQKLRQIGLNYDIANAKGISELTEEERKQREQKKKEAAEKKKKKMQEEAKEKADLETWKKEEKADYEAWKRKKARHARLSDTGVDKTKTKDEEVKTDAAADATETAKVEEDASSPSTIAEVTTDVKDEANKGDTDVKDAEAGPEAGNENETEHEDDTGDHAEAQETPEDAGHPDDLVPIADGPGPSPGPYRPMYRRHPDSIYGDGPQPPPPRRSRPPPDNAPKPWNAVCVLGLRVYSQDSGVSIKLVKPKDAEEGAILDVDGDTPAGATM